MKCFSPTGGLIEDLGEYVLMQPVGRFTVAPNFCVTYVFNSDGYHFGLWQGNILIRSRSITEDHQPE